MVSIFTRRGLALVSTIALSASFTFAGTPAFAMSAAALQQNSTAPTVDLFPWDSHDDFYSPPKSFPRTPGKVVRTQGFTVPLMSPKGIGATRTLRGQRVMYTSTQSDGVVTTTTGALIQPTHEYKGKAAKTPLIVMGPGTLGQGAQCAASRNVATMLGISFNRKDGMSDSLGTVLRERKFDTDQLNKENPVTLVTDYEAMVVYDLLHEGYGVFLIDYIGGSTGPQSYVNNIEAGRTMLDAARAARQLGVATATTPIGFWGYSQGGAAAALGGILHSTYAPDVNLKGIYAGAPPLDLAEVNDTVDGGAVAGVLGFAINSYLNRYPEAKSMADELLNDTGKTVLRKLSHACIVESVEIAGFRKSSDYTKDGSSFGKLLRTNPLMQRILNEQLKAAWKTPDVPMMVLSNRYDNVVSYPQIQQYAQHWMSGGATITFVSMALGPFPEGGILGHFLPGLDAIPVALRYMEDRLSDVPAPESGTVDLFGNPVSAA